MATMYTGETIKGLSKQRKYNTVKNELLIPLLWGCIIGAFVTGCIAIGDHLRGF
jgi:hypothetical protein